MHVAFIILLALSGLFFLAQTANLVFMIGSDGLSRILSHAIGVLLSAGLWLCLAALFVLARVKASFPSFAGWAVLIGLPASFAGMMATNHLFKAAFDPSWLVAAAAIPPLVLALFVIALWFPALRVWVEPFGVNCAVWGLVGLLSVLPWACVLRRTLQVET